MQSSLSNCWLPALHQERLLSGRRASCSNAANPLPTTRFASRQSIVQGGGHGLDSARVTAGAARGAVVVAAAGRPAPGGKRPGPPGKGSPGGPKGAKGKPSGSSGSSAKPKPKAPGGGAAKPPQRAQSSSSSSSSAGGDSRRPGAAASGLNSRMPRPAGASAAPPEAVQPPSSALSRMPVAKPMTRGSSPAELSAFAAARDAADAAEARARKAKPAGTAAEPDDSTAAAAAAAAATAAAAAAGGPLLGRLMTANTLAPTREAGGAPSGSGSSSSSGGGGSASALAQQGLAGPGVAFREAQDDGGGDDDEEEAEELIGEREEGEEEGEEGEEEGDGDGFLLVEDEDAGEGGADDGGDDEGEGEEELFPEIQLNLPPPTKVKVKAAEYMQSCVTVADCPPPRYPEFAVIGRSNVGKSSLINMITGRKDLALVSKEPGKTKCINHFIINENWYLVDLPGYGFAKVGFQGRQQFETFTKEYFNTRPNLAMVLLLVDASIKPQRIDLEYANWLTDNEVPFAIVFTKADKRRKGLTAAVRDSHVTAFKRALLRDLAYLPPSLLTSAARGLGRGELLSFIAGLRVAYERSGRLEAIRQGMI
ncbi:hypothetical protein HXX76_004660 [Chlamydomonas incerta]|uniref:EngB-type G domain-containing protein n=1 Tax=Chlamydomonas incerta TaxID=51695 RepID=A0A835W867_CHLIN|nr:hypothetical protein HXX76_004660 [Chlamydomonas incerta]|eukprot:KAG2439301.1 hypothetical protein HXX76_004660 [Chlamydomonas incerta]